jgi:UTP--glucose-1-phosphate uridylyltransferase
MEAGNSCVAIMEVPQKDVVKYGIIDGVKEKEGLYRVRDVVEKPKVDKAPSRFALPGRYVFTSKIYEHLMKVKPGVGGEIQLTDGMNGLARANELLAATFSAKRYDAGDKLGFLVANIEIALNHPELKEDLKNYIKELSRKI